MWIKSLSDLVVKPLFRRAGTAIATAIVVGGDKLCDAVAQTCGLVTQSGAVAVAEYVVVVLLVGVDLFGSWVERSGRQPVPVPVLPDRVRPGGP